ncbi:hypothetical protein SORBI_3008G108100 [Sorghum bicolor]|uniref:Uncharacterized protein n=1 Tax=Sorghum bicolor TaxID=4558 RepID=A0A1B6PDC9_SORBI|nr:hypothetical protein SORBI_3008G108100 [Sorghum bicolor]
MKGVAFNRNSKQRSNRTRFELLPARNLNSSNAWLQAFNRNTRYELNRLGEAVDSARKKKAYPNGRIRQGRGILGSDGDEGGLGRRKRSWGRRRASAARPLRHYESGSLITASPEPPSRRYVSVATVPALVGVSDSFWAPMLFWGW